MIPSEYKPDPTDHKRWQECGEEQEFIAQV